MTIRRLTAHELDEVFALSQFAFQYELPEKEWQERKSREKPEETWGFFVDDRLAAKMKIMPLEVFIHGTVFSMGGISSVATWPEYRRQGMIKQLLTHGLQVMKEAGQSVSFLAPFSFAYYRKYGWEHVFDEKQYTVELDKLPHFNDASGIVKRKQLSDSLPLLNAIYEQFARKYNGPLKRSNDWWKYRSVLQDKKAIIAVYYDQHDVPKGYMVFKVKDREMDVKEFVHTDEDSRRGLWQFISNHDSMLQKVVLTAPVDDVLPFLLENPRIKQEILPYFMARIVDVKAFIEQYPFHRLDEVESGILHIKDQYAPWNNGSFTVTINTDGKANVTPYNELNTHRDSRSSTSGLSCDIQTLSAMLLGYQCPSTLHEIGRLKVEEKDVLHWEKVIPQRTTYLPDFF